MLDGGWDDIIDCGWTLTAVFVEVLAALLNLNFGAKVGFKPLKGLPFKKNSPWFLPRKNPPLDVSKHLGGPERVSLTLQKFRMQQTLRELFLRGGDFPSLEVLPSWLKERKTKQVEQVGKVKNHVF